MKKLYTGIVCLFLTTQLTYAQSHAQATLEGTVLDSAEANGLPGASISLTRPGAKETRGAATDDAGHFRISEPTPGQYLLTITEISHTTLTRTVTLAPGVNKGEYVLDKLALFLRPVEIKALRAGDKAPFSAVTLTAKDLSVNNVGQDIPYLLDQTPSAVINTNSGNGVGYTGISIRGVDETRINVTLNGIPVNDAEDQGVYFVDLPDLASSISSVQVQRGVGTSTNGAGAFGASMNISTTEFSEKPYGEVDNSVGSYSTWKTTVRVGSGLFDDHFTLDARVSAVTSLGYVDRGSSNLKSMYVSGAYLTPRSSLRFTLISGTEKTYQTWDGVPEAKLYGTPQELRTYYDQNIGTYFFSPEDSTNLFKSNPRTYNYFTYPNQTDNYTQNYYQFFFNHSFDSRWDLNTAGFLTRGYGYYIEYLEDQPYSAYGQSDPVFNGDTIESTNLIQQLWLNNWYYGGIGSLQYHTAKDQVILGGGWTRYDGQHYGVVTWAQQGFPNDDMYYFDEAHKTDWNVYAKWQHRFSQAWSSFVDLQSRTIEYYINGFDDNPSVYVHRAFEFVNPKAGISYTGRGGWSGYLSASIAGHEPNRDDFEANQQQQPQAEHLLDLEANVGKKASIYSWNSTFYYMYYNDQLVLTGKINDVGEYTRTNIPVSYRAGIELQGSVKPFPWFDAQANFTLCQNKISNFTEYLDDYDNGTQKENLYHSSDIALSPDIIGGATLDFLPARSLTLSLISKYVSRQYLDNTAHVDRSLNPYFYENARAVWTVPQRVFRQVQVILMVYNVFSNLYAANGYNSPYIQNGQVIPDNFYFPVAPINYMAALNISL